MTQKNEISEINKLISLAYDSVFNDPSEGLLISRKAYNKSMELNYNKGIAESKLQEGWCLLVKSDVENALQALEKSINIFKSIDNKEGLSKSFNAIGALYRNINDHNRAMDYYIKALELSLDINDPNIITASYINIGELYSKLQKYDEALNYFQKAEQLLKDTNNIEQLSTCQVNIGNIYANFDNIKKSLYYYNEGLINAKTSKNRIAECKGLTSIGIIHQKTGDYTEAEKSHFESLQIAGKTGDRLSKSECLINLGNLYLQTEKYDKALELFNNTLDISKSINSQYFEMLSYLGISNCYESLKSFEKSLSIFRQYHHLKTKLNQNDISIHLKTRKVQKRIAAAEQEIEELQRAFDRVSILNKIGQDITSSLNLETVIKTIYKNISSFISADLFGIALYDNDKEQINFQYFLNEGARIKYEKHPLRREGSLASWAITNGKSLLINDLRNEYLKYVPKLIRTAGKAINSLIFVPLKTGSTITGIITVQSYSINDYTDRHLEMIQAVGAYSSIALENSRVHYEIRKLNKVVKSEKTELEKAYQKIDRLANHDILTGLPNRRLFIELLKPALKQADRNMTKTAVLFIDLDDFKPVNDKLGHDAGDRVLQMVAQRFTSSLRESDSIARIGGDEFAAIICNSTNKANIEKIADKIIQKFSNPFKIENHKFNIGISMGISIYPDDDREIDGLLKKADTAMYQIKADNKNSFIFLKNNSPDRK